MTKPPTKTIEACPTPAELMPAIVVLRDAALKAANFDYAVILSHTHAWLYWLNENKQEIDSATE